MSRPEDRRDPASAADGVGLCALSAVVALGIPAVIHLSGGAPRSTDPGVGVLYATLLVGALAATGAIVQARRARPAPAGWATALFLLATGFAVVQVPSLMLADAASGVCCLLFVIGAHLPTGHDRDRAAATTRTHEEFRPALIGAFVATPALIITTMISSRSSVLIGIAAGLLAVAILVGLGRRLV